MPKPVKSPLNSLGEKYKDRLEFVLSEIKEDQKKLLTEGDRHPEDIAKDINTLARIRSEFDDLIEMVKDRLMGKASVSFSDDED